MCISKILIVFLLICPFAWATDYTQDANCQGAWLFGEGSGTTVTDSSPNSNTGNFKGNGEPAWSASVPNAYSTYSADFDGTDDYIDCGNSDTLMPENVALTVVAWANIVDAGDGLGNIVNRDAGTIGPLFRMRGNGASAPANTLDFRVDGSTDLTVRSTAGILIGEYGKWHHTAITWDGSTTATNVHIYFDGSETGYDTQTNGADLVDNSADNFYIGNNAGTTQTFNDLLTAVAVFNRVLDSTEINDIIDNGLAGAAPPSRHEMFTVF